MSVVESGLVQYLFKNTQTAASAVLMAATDPHGRVIGGFDGGPAPDQINRAHAKMAAESDQLGDRMFSVANELIVSDRAWTVLQEMSDTDHLHAIETMVIDPTRAPVATAWWLVPTRSFDALHRELARYRYNQGANTIGRILKWALDENQVPPLALWHETNGQWFASQAFLQRWAHEEFTGARFEEVPVA